MRDQELVRRFLALYFESEAYEKPMKEFLNVFMGRNRNLKKHSEAKLRGAFEPTVELAHKILGSKAFKPAGRLNAAVFDAVMVGLARRLEKGALTDHDALKKTYGDLTKNLKFLEAVQTGTAKQESVSGRLELATNAFAQLK